MIDATVNLRRIFADICRGFTKISLDNKDYYVKHLSHFEQVDIDSIWQEYYEAARRRRIPTKEEKIKWLEDEGIWTKGMQTDLENQLYYVKNMEKTKSKMALKSQIEMIQKTLDVELAKYNTLEAKKRELIGYLAEHYADQKMQNYYIFNTFYADDKLEKRAFTDKQFKNLDDDEMSMFMDGYIDLMDRISGANIKKISVSDFFTSYFYLSEDLATFFNKALCDLSYYQINLISFGTYYKSIFANNQIPDAIRSEPEKIDQFLTQAQNLKKMAEKAGKKHENVGIVGARREDLDLLGSGYNTSNSTNIGPPVR